MECCVPFCKSKAEIAPEDRGITFHKFPSEVDLRAAWIRALGKHIGHLPDSAVICSQHFLDSEIYKTESGSIQICPNAIPSMAKICMICLDTHSKLILMNQYNLDKVYEHLVGHPMNHWGNLRQTLCVQCAQRLMNFSKFRDKSMKALTLLTELVEKHELITIQHMDIEDEIINQFKNNIEKTALKLNHYDLYIKQSNTDGQYISNATANAEIVKVKTETHIPPSDVKDKKSDMILRTEEAEGFDINLVVTKKEYTSDKETKLLPGPLFLQLGTSEASVEPLAPIKYEVPLAPIKYEVPLAPIKYEVSFECSLCLEEFPNEDTYNYHMTMHLKENHEFSEQSSAEFGQYAATSKRAPFGIDPNKSMLNERAHISDGTTPPRISRETSPSAFNSHCKLNNKLSGNNKNKSLKTISHKSTKNHKSLVNEDTSKLLTDYKNKLLSMRCMFCQYKSNNGVLLVEHMRTHVGEKPVACMLCDYRCPRKSDLVKHMIIHTGLKPFACDVCDYKCSRNSDLVKHTVIHTGEKRFSCNLCGFKFLRKSDLIRHTRTHTGEKPYACTLCKYKCSDKGNLSHHLKKHTNVKPFSCDLCTYKTSIKSSLATHMNIHTGIKPFSCKTCDFTCSIKSSLTRHMKTHLSKDLFSCEKCDYRCSIKRNLTRHIIHHK